MKKELKNKKRAIHFYDGVTLLIYFFTASALNYRFPLIVAILGSFLVVLLFSVIIRNRFVIKPYLRLEKALEG